MKKTIIIAAIMLLVAGTASLDARTKKKASKSKASTSQVIYTGEIAKKVIGYNGPVPLKRATAKVLPQYIGKTVAEAKKLDADIATGATYTSKAIIQNIQMGLDQAKSSSTTKKATKKKSSKKRR